jgi:hypothetical protein
MLPDQMLESQFKAKCMASAGPSSSARLDFDIFPALSISIVLFGFVGNPATWPGQMLEGQSRAKCMANAGPSSARLDFHIFQHSPYALCCLVSLGIQPRGQIRSLRCSPGENAWPLQCHLHLLVVIPTSSQHCL